jgi:hypothetical protein
LTTKYEKINSLKLSARKEQIVKTIDMIQNRKETAWKKNRRFSEIHGGRARLKCADGIFKRYHSLLAPSENEERPIFFVENPSKDFFFLYL